MCERLLQIQILEQEASLRPNLIVREDLHTAADDCEMCMELKWETKTDHRNIWEFSQRYCTLCQVCQISDPSVCVRNVTSYWDYSANKRTNRKNRPEQFVLFFHNESHILNKVNNSKFKLCRNKTNQKNAPHSITSNFVAFQKSWYKHFFFSKLATSQPSTGIVLSHDRVLMSAGKQNSSWINKKGGRGDTVSRF